MQSITVYKSPQPQINGNNFASVMTSPKPRRFCTVTKATSLAMQVIREAGREPGATRDLACRDATGKTQGIA